MMIKSTILLCFIGVTLGQVPHFGKCPDIGVQQNFDLNKYLGAWYEIEKFFFFIEGQETCVTANYSVLPDGKVRVDNKGLQPDGSLEEAIGDATVPDPNQPAKFAVSFYDSPSVPYWVVETDYDTFSLVWSCTDLVGFVQADFAWILSRKPTMDASLVQKLKNDLAAFGVNTNSFLKTSQANCPATTRL